MAAHLNQTANDVFLALTKRIEEDKSDSFEEENRDDVQPNIPSLNKTSTNGSKNKRYSVKGFLRTMKTLRSEHPGMRLSPIKTKK